MRDEEWVAGISSTGPLPNKDVIMVHVDQLLIFVLFCVLFFLICGSTFFYGLQLIIKRVGINNRFALIYLSLLLAVVAFEFTLIGSVLDPKVTTYDWKSILTISTYAGIVTFLGAIVITLLYFFIIRIIKWFYRFITSSSKNK